MKKFHFVLLGVITPHYHQDIALSNMKELEQLVETFGGEIVEKSVQHRVNPNPDTYIGEGKLEWLKETVKEKKIDVVVLNDIVKSSQLFRLERSLWAVNRRIAIWDRVDLILHIFELHAQSNEAKLQIELARIKHIGPRIYGLGGTVLSKQGAGIGTRGAGETNIEKERRKIKQRTQQIEKELKKLASVRQNRITSRKRAGLHMIALVGYTSAGKTTLFNTLTKKEKTTHQGLFTTLDSVTGKLKPINSLQPFLISDTIGFIDHLPPALIEAFHSTLLESLTADILLHVIDASDPKVDEKIKIVQTILSELGASQTTVLVFNKIDLATEKQLKRLKKRYAGEECLFVSAKTHDGIESLQKLLTVSMPSHPAHNVKRLREEL